MGTSAILYTGLRALFAQQAAIQVTGQNIANVNTPGYSRQRVVLVPEQIPRKGDFLLAGVSADQITRVFDRFINAQVNTASANMHSTQAQADFLGQVEALFNELSLEDAGLAGTLNRFFQAFHELASNPQGLPERTAVLEQGRALAQSFQQLQKGLSDIQQDLSTTVTDEITQINNLARRIAELNVKIQQFEVDPKQHANTLRDERDLALKQLAEKVQVSSFENSDGLTVLLGGGRPLVEGSRVNALVAKADADDPTQRTIFMQDAQGNLTEVTDSVLGGRLHGLLQLKADFLPDLQRSLDRLAAKLTSAVNTVHRRGYGLDGSTEVVFFIPRQVSAQALAANQGGGSVESVTVFDPTQLTLDEYRITFTADSPQPQFDIVNVTTGETVASGQNYTAGAAIFFDGIKLVLTDNGQSPQKGDVFVVDTIQNAARNLAVDATVLHEPRKIAAARTPVASDGANALALAQIGDAAILDDGTLAAFYTSLVTKIGVKRQHTSDLAAQQQRLLTELENRRESISGVSLDEEQVDLIRFQQGFAAAANLIRVANEMTQTVMDMVR